MLSLANAGTSKFPVSMINYFSPGDREMKIPSARWIRTGAILAAAGAAVLAVGGCGGSGGGATHDAATGSKAPAASAAPEILKGSALKGLLLPASALPKGFRIEADGTRNSGEAVAPRTSAPV